VNPGTHNGLYIGLISGTSRDGLDAALVRFEDDRPKLLQARCTPYPASLRSELDDLLATGLRPGPERVTPLDLSLGEFFAAEALALLRDNDVKPEAVTAIGSHGQTVWHEPGGNPPVSLQLGNGAIIAAVTGVTTVTSFRTADLLAGGQGAPLAPLLHRQLFAREDKALAVLNLGGISNLTCIAADGSVTGFDCGPANCLMDGWIKRHQGLEFDADGQWAASGKVLPKLLERFLQEPYFALEPPKSTGLELFNPAWLDQAIQGSDYAPEDVQRTLAELTVRTVADCFGSSNGFGQLLVCGGGVHNGFLMDLLADRLPGLSLASTASLGVSPDWVEAILFAWLARERLQERAQDTRAITGAGKPVLLGTVHTT
jgi:anhydro-N-acetylmuramic acid kinase